MILTQLVYVHRALHLKEASVKATLLVKGEPVLTPLRTSLHW